ncbi:hypothetical protein [Arthrobacter sp. OV608]|uniref:hypothetical protein n=1 Tax=Arthrobacter sp. OV608 TaxID=1882768 RepID=UPI0008BF5413|nr:hypothetical protein [Arthrobacter sp. OV608]SEQ69874.1 hypothetical protein SAMN05444745_109126 [Arthrobacter sp. OV608]
MVSKFRKSGSIPARRGGNSPSLYAPRAITLPAGDNVVTDRNLLESEEFGDLTFGPNGWGLERLSPVERAGIAINVGVDQFGGDRNPALIEDLVDSGIVRESRIDESVRRLLREKFPLGLFENRRVSVDQARNLCGSPVYVEKGKAAQRASLVLLSDDLALITHNARLFVEGIEEVDGFETMADPAAADAILVRLDAPF